MIALRAGGAETPRETLNRLNTLRLNTRAVYTITTKDRVELREGDVSISFQEGKLSFYEAFDGKVTGFVYSGLGHVVALPRNSVEKQQVALFLKTPVLDQEFVSGYFRFTDDAGDRMMEEMKRAGIEAKEDVAFVGRWSEQVQRLNPSHSLRILLGRYYAEPKPFFHAGIDGVLTGPFDIVVDDSREENFFMGQPRSVGGNSYYDVWCSYALPGRAALGSGFTAPHYQIETTIHADNSLEGDTQVEFRATEHPPRVLVVALARALKVESVTGEDGKALAFFQNEGITERRLRKDGDDLLCVFFDEGKKAGEKFTLRFRYHGNVIADAGNGVLFVGSRESWYPHYGDAGSFAMYDMTMRWPRRLLLVATGEKSETKEEGEYRSAHWKTSTPVPEAGFNLGEYATTSVVSATRSVDVYANKQLEESVRERLARATPPPTIGTGIHGVTGEALAAEAAQANDGVYGESDGGVEADRARSGFVDYLLRGIQRAISVPAFGGVADTGGVRTGLAGIAVCVDAVVFTAGGAGEGGADFGGTGTFSRCGAVP